MDQTRWEHIQAIFHAAVDLPIPERQAFLREACADDPLVEDAVRELLDEDARTASLLDRDVAQVAEDLLSSPEHDPRKPGSIGRYRILSRLGEGGMGIVYLAEREDLGHRVAVKILRDAWVSPARRERFLVEQRTLAQLNHPSIARIYDADTLPDGTPWFAMEYVEGMSLTSYCSARACSMAERLRLFRDVCEAVQHAHQRLIVHRDLKPSNILVNAAGGVKLLDFGIAKQLETIDGSSHETQSFVRLMTPAYAAPEQLRGERASLQTDVYALGVILYELLSGRRPFDLSDRTPAEADAIVMERTATRPSIVNHTAAQPLATGRSSWADLDVLCLTAMHKDPSRRYHTVEALLRDLDHFGADEPLEVRADSLGYRGAKFLRRNAKAVSAAVTGAILLAALIGFYTLRLASLRDAALAEAARTQRVQRFMLNLFGAGDEQAPPAANLKVVTLVERGVMEARSLESDPVIQAELYQTLGSIQQRLGNYDQADTLLQTALDRRRQIEGAHHPDTSDNLVALGLLRVDQAKLEEAERLVREGLTTLRRTVPPQHPSIARALAALGVVLRERGKYDEAVPILEETVRLYSSAPASTADLAATMTALANTHFYAGRFDRSDELNRRVLEIDRKLYGQKHPSVADDLINLGASQTSRGNHDAAGRYYREALDIIEPWYGNDHPETASAKTVLAQALVPQGKLDDAAALLRDALATQERVYGGVHPRVAFVLNELGMVAMRRKDYEEARQAFTRAMDVYSEIYKGRHPRVGIAMANLASVDLARGDYDRAAQLFEDALELYAVVLPKDHLNVAIAQSKLGRTRLKQRRFSEAATHLIAAYETLRKQQTPTSVWLQNVREDLVATYAALGQTEKAAQLRVELAQNQTASR